MKAVFIGDNAEVASFATTSLRLRWPDCIPAVAATPAPGLELVEEHSPDVVLFHVAGTDQALSPTIQELRRFSAVPLLVMSAQPDQLQLIKALEMGADDYVRLPCGLPELMARVLAVLRRAGTQRFDDGRGILVKGDLLINPATFEAFIRDRRLKLTVTEFRLLHVLASNSDRVVSHQTLEQSLWGDRWNGNSLLKKYVQRLRTKLDNCAPLTSYITSVHGVGYRFIGACPPTLEPADAAGKALHPKGVTGPPETSARPDLGRFPHKERTYAVEVPTAG